MGTLKGSNKTAWAILTITFFLITGGNSEAACSYVTSTVKDTFTKDKLPVVTVFVTDDIENKDETRTDDALYSLTIKDRGMPYALEFNKDGYGPKWLSNLSCTGELTELQVVYMTKLDETPKLTNEQLMDILTNYKEALKFAKIYKQRDLRTRVREAFESLATILKKSERPADEILGEIYRLLDWR